MTGERPSHFYMANLGPEIMRAFLFFEKGFLKEYEGAVASAERIIEQFLAAHPSLGGRQEALLWRDLVRNMGESRHALSQKTLDQYFTPFALRAMQEARM